MLLVVSSGRLGEPHGFNVPKSLSVSVWGGALSSGDTLAVCVGTCGGQRLALGSHGQASPLRCLRQGPSLNLGLAFLARLAAQPVFQDRVPTAVLELGLPSTALACMCVLGI